MKTRSLIAATSALLLMSASAMAAELKIGLGSDADVLDPAQSRTFVGRIVYTAMCDKLVDVEPGPEDRAAVGDRVDMVGRRQGTDHEAA